MTDEQVERLIRAIELLAARMAPSPPPQYLTPVVYGPTISPQPAPIAPWNVIGAASTSDAGSVFIGGMSASIPQQGA